MTSAMINPGGDKQGILSLPIEILHGILSSLPDPRTLTRTVLTCRQLYAVFKNNEGAIVSAVVTNCIGFAVLPEAVLAHDCAPPELVTSLTKQQHELEIEDRLTNLHGYIKQFLQKELQPRRRPPSRYTMNKANLLCDFHLQVVCPLKEKFIMSLGHGFFPYTEQLGLSLRDDLWLHPISRLEEERIYRNLYRFEIFRKLFGHFCWREEDLLEYSQGFFGKFTKWELAQLGCIHDFLAREIIPVFNDVAAHDITWGAFSVNYDADIKDGEIQHLLTLGLARILEIMALSAEPYSTREAALTTGYTAAAENGQFLAMALEALEFHRDDDDPPSLPGFFPETAFYDDDDVGPEENWLATRGDIEALGVYDDEQYAARAWGYVFWDQRRLLELGLRESTWATEVLINTDTRTGPSIEDMAVTWRARYAFYQAGRRGRWDKDEQPEKKMKQGESSARAGLESLEETKEFLKSIAAEMAPNN